MPFLLALLLTVVAAPDLSPIIGTAPGTVHVRGGDWTGSAVIWDAAARRVLTALHVVEGMPPDLIEVVIPGRGPVPARIVDRDPALDLAVLEVGAELHAAAPLGDARKLAGGAAIALTACGASHCAPVPGRVVASSRAFAGSHYLAVAAHVAPGASGGAVLDGDGAVVGIVDLALAREPGTALAVPIHRALARFPRD